MTPHEHRGIGTPSNEAKKTENKESDPKYFCTISTVKNSDNRPEMKNPKIK